MQAPDTAGQVGRSLCTGPRNSMQEARAFVHCLGTKLVFPSIHTLMACVGMVRHGSEHSLDRVRADFEQSASDCVGPFAS